MTEMLENQGTYDVALPSPALIPSFTECSPSVFL